MPRVKQIECFFITYLFLDESNMKSAKIFIISNRPKIILTDKRYFPAVGSVEKLPNEPIVSPKPGPTVPNVATDAVNDVTASRFIVDRISELTNSITI